MMRNVLVAMALAMGFLSFSMPAALADPDGQGQSEDYCYGYGYQPTDGRLSRSSPGPSCFYETRKVDDGEGNMHFERVRICH
jgi:hypothetical protein